MTKWTHCPKSSFEFDQDQVHHPIKLNTPFEQSNTTRAEIAMRPP